MATVFIGLFIYSFVSFMMKTYMTQSNPIIILSIDKVALFDHMFSQVFILIPLAREAK